MRLLVVRSPVAHGLAGCFAEEVLERVDVLPSAVAGDLLDRVAGGGQTVLDCVESHAADDLADSLALQLPEAQVEKGT